MKKFFLSFCLSLVLALSLSVSAYADGYPIWDNWTPGQAGYIIGQALHVLPFLRRVAFLIPKFTGMYIAAPPQFVVDRPLTESQLSRDLPHRYLVPPHGFQLMPLCFCHIVPFLHLPVPPQ